MPLISKRDGESKRDFISRCVGDDKVTKEFPDQKQRLALCFSRWGEKKSKASLILTDENGDEILYGVAEEDESEEAYAAQAEIEAEAEMETFAKKGGKEPYGDVPYADPGYQKDGKKRYPLDSEQHVRSAHSYFSKPSNYERYTPEQRAKIRARIRSAWKRLIDPKGPPSDQE